jgi:predicted protein tyrosine phosphatase
MAPWQYVTSERMEMSQLTVKILSRAAVIQYRPGPKELLVSISGLEDARADVSGYDAICCLTVSTGPRGAEETAAPTFQVMEEARRLVDFLEKHASHAHMIVVQCQAGISRSPAVAAAIALLYPCHTTCQAILKRYPAFNVELFQAIIDEWTRRRLHTFSLSSHDDV